MSDDLIFIDEPASAAALQGTWPLAIVDDDPEVHSVTELALSDFRFGGRGLTFLHAYSGEEAQAMLRAHPEVALVLLDVVMETERAGLKVVEFVRNELKNHFIRIILRTGEPGQAPELDVITRYDINDYKNKTELTRTRLFTTVYTGLTTYRDLVALEANRRGLEKVIEASAHIFEMRSMAQFTQGVLEQLSALLFLGHDSVMVHCSGVAAEGQGALRIVAATGSYAPLLGHDARAVLPSLVIERIEAARTSDSLVYGTDYFVRDQKNGDELIFYIGADVPLSVPDRRLVDLFCQNAAIAHRNIRLLQNLVGGRPTTHD